jgi:hypothetical protein
MYEEKRRVNNLTCIGTHLLFEENENPNPQTKMVISANRMLRPSPAYSQLSPKPYPN